MKNKYWLVIFAVIVVVGLVGILISQAKSNTMQTTRYNLFPANYIQPVYENGSIEIHFCPSEDCLFYLEGFIRSSGEIECALYDLSLNSTISLLKEKNARLVIDKDNLDKIKDLNYKTNNNTKQLMHNKFCVSNYSVFTGSLNPSKTHNVNDNNIVIIQSKYLAENYKHEFEELWNGEFSEGKKVKYPEIYLNEFLVENYFCPEDNCEKHVLETLGGANSSIYFLTYSFTSDPIGELLIKKFDEEVYVAGVFEKSQNSKWTEFQKLQNAGLDVKWDRNKNAMHHKVFVVDGEIVITGSYNPTASANEKNDENILIIHNQTIAEQYLKEFERVWGV